MVCLAVLFGNLICSVILHHSSITFDLLSNIISEDRTIILTLQRITISLSADINGFYRIPLLFNYGMFFVVTFDHWYY